MPRVRPSMGLHNLGRGKAELASLYVSDCKICELGIYKGQPHRFSTGKVLGLVHDDCIEPEPAP
ncbi:hypothetical protein [Micromonospora sp. CB01531]|uniref:hypothetical protein n=1 Tax=Micromonospora sp. CB01531 TaxID=1718947 RepID=UPI000A968828|nr:hypothetical protein [Micromonospora sp. CB01531]